MAAPVIFINTYAVKKGKLADFRQFLQEFFGIIEADEARALAINAYVNEDGTEATFVQVHPDAASMEHHHRVAHEHTEGVWSSWRSPRASRSTANPATSSWRRRDTRREWSWPRVAIMKILTPTRDGGHAHG